MVMKVELILRGWWVLVTDRQTDRLRNKQTLVIEELLPQLKRTRADAIIQMHPPPTTTALQLRFWSWSMTKSMIVHDSP